MRALVRTAPLSGVCVTLPESANLILPEECACCGAPSSHSVALQRAQSSLHVRYCDECAEHQAAHSSRGLALSLASLLLALTSAAGLPLLAPRLGWFGLCALTLLVALLPLAALLVPRRAPSEPHAARGLAVTWGEGGGGARLLCAAPRFGRAVASLNDGRVEPALIRERVASAWLWSGPVIGVGAACLAFFVYHPLLRVLNLGSVAVRVALDGVPLVDVDPTSNESPAAGALMRVPVGAHRLSVSSTVDGAPLGSLEVELQSGAAHLFAFGSEDTCFWLESNGYGLEQRIAPSYQPLPSPDRFWVLPGGIDTWFSPNPDPSDPGARSTGGILTALRQAPCSEAPPEARPTN